MVSTMPRWRSRNEHKHGNRIPTLLHLYFIRHGETEWSLTGRHTGRTDIPLTANGENEARELGRHLRDIPFAQVLTSPLQRARKTCELVGLDKASKIEPALAEWDYGDYEGQRSVDIRKCGRTGSAFGMVVRKAKRPHKLANVPTGSSFIFVH